MKSYLQLQHYIKQDLDHKARVNHHSIICRFYAYLLSFRQHEFLCMQGCQPKSYPSAAVTLIWSISIKTSSCFYVPHTKTGNAARMVPHSQPAVEYLREGIFPQRSLVAFPTIFPSSLKFFAEAVRCMHSLNEAIVLWVYNGSRLSGVTARTKGQLITALHSPNESSVSASPFLKKLPKAFSCFAPSSGAFGNDICLGSAAFTSVAAGGPRKSESPTYQLGCRSPY